jgi:hypothetical protein
MGLVSVTAVPVYGRVYVQLIDSPPSGLSKKPLFYVLPLNPLKGKL